MSRRGAAVALSLLVALAACTTAPPSPSPAASPATVPPTATLAPIPGVSPGDVALQCDRGGPAFSLASLQEAPAVEPAGLDAASEALADELATSGDPALPATGWRRVAYSGDRVLFVAAAREGGDSPFVQLALMFRNGAWETDTVGRCRLRVVLAADADPAPWWLDPDAPEPSEDELHLAALVQEIACASGEPPVGRIVPPVIVYGEQAVVVTFATRPLGGNQECPGAPPAPYEFDLREPLGARTLLDGSSFPLADARIPYHDR